MKVNFALAALAASLAVGTAGAPVEVIPPSLRGAMQPQAAIAPDGTIHVAFGRSGAVYCATSTDGGSSFKAPVAIGSLPKLALGMRRGPRIVATGKTVVVSAISHADGNLVTWLSNDRGTTWGPPARVNSMTNSAREGMHAMAGDSQGTVHLAWLDLRSGKTQLFGATSRDGGHTWGANVLIYQSPDGHICECCHPSLVADARGRVWAMWRNWLNGARDMYARVSEDGGRTFSQARKLGTGTWPLKACPMDGGHPAIAPDGQLRTTWRREKAVFAADDRTETLLAAQGLHPVIGFDRDTPFYLWQTGSELMLKKGTNQPVVFADKAAFASVASGSFAGAPLVVWEGMTNGAKTIFAQRIE